MGGWIWENLKDTNIRSVSYFASICLLKRKKIMYVLADVWKDTQNLERWLPLGRDTGEEV